MTEIFPDKGNDDVLPNEMISYQRNCVKGNTFLSRKINCFTLYMISSERERLPANGNWN